MMILAAVLFSAALTAQDSMTEVNPEQVVTSTEVLTQEAEVDTSWKTGGVFGLNFGQTALKNWAAGGANSVALGGLFNHFRNYKKGVWTWDNNLDLAYGMLWQGDNEGIKTDDRIELSSKAGRELRGPWYGAFLLNFRSQFAEGFDDPFAADSLRNTISRFMAPGYGLASLGFDYKPSENFTAFISPMTAKFTFVMDQDLADVGAFGVDQAIIDPLTGDITTEGENIRAEFGAFAKAQYNTNIVENVDFMTRIDLFANYETLDHVDINWEALLSMKVNKYITATVAAQVLYDHDIDIFRVEDDKEKFGPTTQFKEVLNVGFTYKF